MENPLPTPLLDEEAKAQGTLLANALMDDDSPEARDEQLLDEMCSETLEDMIEEDAVEKDAEANAPVDAEGMIGAGLSEDVLGAIVDKAIASIQRRQSGLVDATGAPVRGPRIPPEIEVTGLLAVVQSDAEGEEKPFTAARHDLVDAGMDAKGAKMLMRHLKKHYRDMIESDAFGARSSTESSPVEPS